LLISRAAGPVYQSKAEVEVALIDQRQTYVLGDQALVMIMGHVRSEIEAQLPQRQDDIAALEAELATATAEQKRLARAVALWTSYPSSWWSCASVRPKFRI